MTTRDEYQPGSVFATSACASRRGALSARVMAFRRLDRRRLVITGGPGSGKTTLAVQLLLELLTHPQPGEPVPVLFSLVGWDPQSQSRVQDWLTARLELDYPALRSFGVNTARALVERGAILPVLDGLGGQSRRGAAAVRHGYLTACARDDARSAN